MSTPIPGPDDPQVTQMMAEVARKIRATALAALAPVSAQNSQLAAAIGYGAALVAAQLFGGELMPDATAHYQDAVRRAQNLVVASPRDASSSH